MKAELFEQSVFLIGYDTYVRIIDTKYYDYSEEALGKVMQDFADKKVSFLVASRND